MIIDGGNRNVLIVGGNKTITINKQGDLDGDGQLTVTDVTSLVNAILGK